MTVEATPAVTAGLTTYRFYVDMQDATDRMSAVFGNDQASLFLETPDGAFNSPLNTSWNATGINPAFLPAFPDLADDTYATIGLTGSPASTSGIAGAVDPSIVEDINQQINLFRRCATGLVVDDLTGAAWYILNTAESHGLRRMRIFVSCWLNSPLRVTSQARIKPTKRDFPIWRRAMRRLHRTAGH